MSPISSRGWRPRHEHTVHSGHGRAGGAPTGRRVRYGRRQPVSPGVRGASQPAPASVEPSAAASQTAVELTFAHSYQDAQPQHACGAKVIADELTAANVGVTTEISGASQLGGDADRIASVAAGDIDMDIQGASALSSAVRPHRDPRWRVRLRRLRSPASVLHVRGIPAAQGRVPRGDRCPDPRRLVGRGPPVHGERADPDAG